MRGSVPTDHWTVAVAWGLFPVSLAGLEFELGSTNRELSSHPSDSCRSLKKLKSIGIPCSVVKLAPYCFACCEFISQLEMITFETAGNWIGCILWMLVTESHKPSCVIRSC
jgi:hypothetical protein